MKVVAQSSLLKSVELGAGVRLLRVIVDDTGGFGSFGFVDGTATVYGEDHGGLGFVDVDSGEKRLLDLGMIATALLSPDGSRIAVQGWDQRSPFVKLFDRGGKLLGEERRLKDQHAQLGFTGNSDHLVIAPNPFGGIQPLHVMDRDGKAQDNRPVDVEPRWLLSVGPTSVAVHGAYNGMQIVDVGVEVGGANSEVIDHGTSGVYTLAVDGDRLVAGAQEGQVMLFSLPGRRVSWPSAAALLEARSGPKKALLLRLAARRAKARSNVHKRFLDDQLKHARATLKKATPVGDRPTIFAGVGGTLNAVALTGDSVIASSDSDVVRVSLPTLREDVLVCCTPAGGLHVGLRVTAAVDDRLLVDVTSGPSWVRERWVLQLLPPPETTERAAAPAGPQKSAAKKTAARPSAAKKTPAKKTPPKKTPAKKTPPKKAAAKKPVSKRKP